MKILRVLLLAAPLGACASLGMGSGGGGGERERLWNDAHRAFALDSLDRAGELFGRLVAAHPESREGREARFFLGALHMDPRNPRFNATTATTNLRAYLASQDSLGQPIYRRHEAETLLELARQVERPCEERFAPLRCTTEVITQRVPAAGQPGGQNGATGGVSPATVERLRAENAEKDAEIRRLREELNRIRNTLVPRRP